MTLFLEGHENRFLSGYTAFALSPVRRNSYFQATYNKSKSKPLWPNSCLTTIHL